MLGHFLSRFSYLSKSICLNSDSVKCNKVHSKPFRSCECIPYKLLARIVIRARNCKTHNVIIESKTNQSIRTRITNPRERTFDPIFPILLLALLSSFTFLSFQILQDIVKVVYNKFNFSKSSLENIFFIFAKGGFF